MSTGSKSILVIGGTGTQGSKVVRLLVEKGYGVRVLTRNIESDVASEETLRLLHQSIKKVTEDLDGLRFNTSVSQLMILVNHLLTLKKLDKNKYFLDRF